MECNIGIVAGSLPTLRPNLKTILGSTYGRNTRKPDASGKDHYGRDTAKGSRSNWQTLGSGRHAEDVEDTSSERALNTGKEDFELSHRGVQADKSVVFSADRCQDKR